MLVDRVQQVEVMGKISRDRARRSARTTRTIAQEFTSPATVTLREILITVPTRSRTSRRSLSVGLEEEAKAKADAVRARVRPARTSRDWWPRSPRRRRRPTAG